MCGVQGSEGKSLASMFSSRNAANIAEALRQTVQNQAEIADKEIEELRALEEAPSVTTGDPEDDDGHALRREKQIQEKRESVMRNHNSVFANGTKLYKLDAQPGGVNISINAGGGTSIRAESMRSNPRALAAEAQRQLEQEYDTITEDLLFERVEQIRQAIAVENDDVIEGEFE